MTLLRNTVLVLCSVLLVLAVGSFAEDVCMIFVDYRNCSINLVTNLRY